MFYTGIVACQVAAPLPIAGPYGAMQGAGGLRSAVLSLGPVCARSTYRPAVTLDREKYSWRRIRAQEAGTGPVARADPWSHPREFSKGVFEGTFMTRNVSVFIVLPCCLALSLATLPLPAFGQVSLAFVGGVTRDSASGQPVPEAQITAHNLDK